MNRLERPLDDASAPHPGDGDYFVVSTRFDSWCVSTAMARGIETDLDAEPARDWVTFVDLHGSRVRLRAREVLSVAQCTADQRASARVHERRLRREAKADRDWEDDDWL